MGIDSNIALGVKPVQLPDPMNAMARVLQVQAAQGQNDLARYSLAKAQRQDAETNALAQLLQGGGVDLSTPEGQAKAFQAAPTVAPSMIKNYMEGRKMTSEIGKNDAQAGNFREEAIGKRTKFYRDQLADVNNPQQAAAWMQANYNDPVVGPILKEKQPLEASISEIPSDPAQFNEWRARQALGMAEYLKQNKPQTHFADVGGSLQVVQTPGLGGAPTVVGQMQKTQSPDSVASNATRLQVANITQAGENARHAETAQIDRVKVDPLGLLGVNKNVTPQAQAQAGLSGEDFLQTLPPGVAKQVKAMAEGKLQISPYTLRTPQGQALLQAAMQYEPGTDQTTFLQRAAMAKDAASGKLAQSNNALNTVAGHLAGLADSAEALNNTGYPLVNSVKNWVQSNVGDPRVKTFNMNMQGVANELERAYRGAGGSENDIKLWRQNLDSANSPEQFREVMAKGAEMLQSKLEANQAQYEQAMGGKSGGFDAITPAARKALERLRSGKKGKGEAAALGGLPDPSAIDAELKRRGVK